MNKRAFTLIELLVVIAIIAILAAILFPVFAQAKTAAKKANAISNTKQVTLSAIMYTSDYDDGILPRYNACGVAGHPNQPQPGTHIWENIIMPYAKNEGVFIDPAAANTKFGGIWDDNGVPGKFGRGWPSIGKNQTIMGWYFSDPANTECPASFPRNGELSLAQPAKTVYFMSSNSGPTASGWRGYLADNTGANTLPGPGALRLAARYNDGSVLSFFDGHAKWYKATAILGNPDAALTTPCQNTSFYTGMYWMDLNAAKLKFNVQDPCISEP